MTESNDVPEDGDVTEDETAPLYARVAERADKKFEQFERRVAERLSVRQAKALTTIVGITALGSTSAAAQSLGEFGDAMCGTGLGQLIGFVFIGAAMYLFIKAVMKGMTAMEKMNSTKQGQQHEGKQQLVDAGTTFSGMFIPALAAGVTEIMGINTVSCLTPSSWSVVGTVIVGVPF
ncbi:uncharacterized protein HfgLR_25265 (plasmid) [Haloferax gibbonsii]|uniref:Uncharacterized protein n=1 Tax=Haloferax gibbonsii TaxID=35746 RepID=A0A871BM97_HALGI|nr:hypothetical protein [Haloferax gibbonsii]QOS14128.1 uncharacterized protein HfgLR_25265 [Haloferax gibbonsii]